MKELKFVSNLEKEICLTEKEENFLINLLFMGVSNYFDILILQDLDLEVRHNEMLRVKKILNKVELDVSLVNSKGEEINEE